MSETIFETLDTRVGETYSKTTLRTVKGHIVNFDIAETQDELFIEFYCENLRMIVKSLGYGQIFLIQIREKDRILLDCKFSKSDLKKMRQIFAVIH